MNKIDVGIKKAIVLPASKPGFTLIEVVLVLAIGGLIFLMAFLAFGQASRNRRDTQRRGDARLLVSAAKNYMTDNGEHPCASTGITGCVNQNVPNGTLLGNFFQYLPDNFNDPSTGQAYVITAVTAGNNNFTETSLAGGSSYNTNKIGSMVFQVGATCVNGDFQKGARGTAVDMSLFVVWMPLENGGHYCLAAG